MNEEQNFKKYFFWILILGIGVLSFFIIRNFFTAIISAFVLTYLLLPVQKLLEKKINKKLAAGIIILGIILILAIGIFFTIKTLMAQGTTYITSDNLGKISGFLEDLLSRFGLSEKFSSYLPTLIEKLGTILLAVIASLPGIGFTIFLTLFISYFFLIDWDKIAQYLKEIIPFKNKNEIISNLADTSNKIVYGIFLIALIEFTIAIIGFKIAGVGFYALFAFFIALAAFIPLLGPAIVWVPLAAVELFRANYYAGIVIIITGLIISVLIDSLLSPVLVGKRAKIHPVTHLLGVFGGVSLFGFFGFIIGPLILSFLIDFIQSASNSS